MRVLQCNTCKKLLQPGQVRAMGEPCPHPECTGRMIAVEEEQDQESQEANTPPEQPEMFPKPQFNPRLFTRDQLRDMVEAAYKKAERSYNAHQKDIEDAKRKELMLQTFEETMQK